MTVPVLAIDFGATSIRVCRVGIGDERPHIDVVHRAAHAPQHAGDGSLRWDWGRLLAELDRGLDLALVDGPVASIGVDTWGVDYGLLDARGDLVEAPFSYRDDRTRGFRSVVDRIGVQRLYRVSGLQPLAFNTIFQLAAHERAQLARATHLLMLPELVVHHLTGAIVAETTSVGTTGLVDVSTGDWSAELCDAIGLDAQLLSPLQEAGTQVGSWRGVPVHLVAGHDTASAVFAGGVPDHAFVSSGTWLLVGREQPTSDTSETARLAGFSNESAAFGGTRLLRNIAGWWLVEECRREWDNADLDILLAEAATSEAAAASVDATDARFLAPTNMVSELRAAAALPATASRATIVRTAVEAMAATTATVIDALPPLDGPPLCGVRVFGGGSRAQLYLDALRRRTDLPVTAGPVEATAIGNALAQGLALGVFDSPQQARATLADRRENAR